MTKKILILAIAAAAVFSLSAQSSVKGISVNGLTGLMTTPTARIGWERSDVGLDFGYTYLGADGDVTHVPRLTLSLFEKLEVAGAFAMGERGTVDDHGFMMAGKFQFYRSGGSSLAAGLDFSNYDWDGNTGDPARLLRPFIVATYSGDFFEAPAVTSMAFGWDLDDGDDDGLDFENFNYSMGFEMSLFPKTFKNYIYWMSDFSNYSFAAYGNSGSAQGLNLGRGIFNSGIRIDPIKNSQYKFVIDVVGTDLLDTNRGFMLDATFGLAL